MTDIPKVILESPYNGGSPEKTLENVEYARKCMLDSLTRGEAPIASHLLYTQVLDDNIPEHRTRGINAGLAWGDVADYTVVYMDRGISSGMQYGIDRAEKDNRKIVYRRLF